MRGMRAIASLLTVLLALTTTLARAGEIVAVQFHAASLGRSWDYNIYLPDGYDATTNRYPVLYLLHGFGGDRDDWMVRGQIRRLADEMIATQTIPPCLIVMPSAGTSWYLDRGEPIETAIVRDLIPEVEAAFRADPQREGRLVAGASMGGYGALRFALRYPQTFAAAALLSPAIYTPLPPSGSASRRSDVFRSAGQFDPVMWQHYNYPSLIEEFRASGERVPLFVVAGSEDELNIGGHVADLARLWHQNHWPGTFLVLTGRHNFDMWRRVMPDALRFLFRQVADPEARLATSFPHRRAR